MFIIEIQAIKLEWEGKLIKQPGSLHFLSKERIPILESIKKQFQKRSEEANLKASTNSTSMASSVAGLK